MTVLRLSFVGIGICSYIKIKYSTLLVEADIFISVSLSLMEAGQSV